MIKIGDIVSRYKYNNDCLFKVVDIKDDIYYLSGLNIRLCASTNIDDLKLEDNVREDDSDIVNNIRDNYENSLETHKTVVYNENNISIPLVQR